MYNQHAQTVWTKCLTAEDKSIEVELRDLRPKGTLTDLNESYASHLQHLSLWLLQAKPTQSQIARCRALTANNQARAIHAGVGRCSLNMRPLDNHHYDGRSGAAWW